MAEIDAKPDFGIENTVDTSGTGDQQLLNSLFETETTAANPDDVSAIATPDDGKGPDGKADPTQLAGKNDDVPGNIAENPEALTNFLLNDEEDEDGEETPPATPPATPDAKAGEEGTPGVQDEEGQDNNNDDGTIAFDNLANELADLGVFSRFDGEEDSIKIDSPEDFLDRFKKEKEMGAQQMISDFIGQFGQEHQEAFQAIYVNGADPREYFSKAAEVSNFAALDLSKEANQERVVRQTLADQGFEPTDVEKEIDKLKSYGDLEDVSKRHHKVLIKKEKQGLANQAEEAKAKNQFKKEQKEQYTENVRNVLEEKIKAKEFDGIPVNVKTANELQDFLLVDKWKTDSGETLTDFDKAVLDLKRPENHQQKVKVALLLKLLEKDPTLSTIKKRGVSTQSSQLFKDVARQKTTANRAEGNKKQPADSWWQKQ